MVFGESFQEPAVASPVAGFAAFGGTWAVDHGELAGPAGDGPKLVGTDGRMVDGEVGVEVRLPGSDGGQRRPGRPGRPARQVGADAFDGYEVSLDDRRPRRSPRPAPARTASLLGEGPCDRSPDRWSAARRPARREDGRGARRRPDGPDLRRPRTPWPPAASGCGTWDRPARATATLHVGRRPAGAPRPAVRSRRRRAVAVSGMWAPVASGSATLGATLDTDRPFLGRQSQRVTFAGGTGDVGVANRGAEPPGDGVRRRQALRRLPLGRGPAVPADVFVSAEAHDGGRRYAEAKLGVAGDGQWHRYDVALTPADGGPGGTAGDPAPFARLGRARPRLPPARRLGPLRRPARPQGRGRG